MQLSKIFKYQLYIKIVGARYFEQGFEIYVKLSFLSALTGPEQIFNFSTEPDIMENKESIELRPLQFLLVLYWIVLYPTLILLVL